MRRTMLVAVIAVASGSLLFCVGAAAQWLPDGIDNPRPRYYDYHPPGVFYGDAAPVGFAASGYGVAPYIAGPAPGTAGYGYGAPPSPGGVAPIAPRPLCGVYRYWRDGVCLDRRGY